ncbi:hypothetical protein SCRES2_gp57 [Synechococcus phage S-CRES2]|nr:hypothetical protein SCRES2_gp57 [Synechococcus phage S-CRES2]
MNFIVLYVLPALVGMLFVGIIFALEEISK